MTQPTLHTFKSSRDDLRHVYRAIRAPQTTELRVPTIFQRPSDFGSALAREEPELLECALDGYEGVYWCRITAYRISADDKRFTIRGSGRG